MPRTEPTSDVPAATGTESPSTHPDAYATAAHRPKVPSTTLQKDGSVVSDFLRDINTRHRAERVQRDIDAGRPLTDDELLQHRTDARALMEQEHDRSMFAETELERFGARMNAAVWMERFYSAIERLSPKWKAAREAQIQADIGAAFPIEAGDQTRQAANEQ